MPQPPRYKYSTGEEEKGTYRLEFKVTAEEKARMQTMCGLDDERSAIVYECLMDCQHTSDMRTLALMFLRLFMLGGWRLNDVKPFVSHKILFGILPHQECHWVIQQCRVLVPGIMGHRGIAYLQVPHRPSHHSHLLLTNLREACTETPIICMHQTPNILSPMPQPPRYKYSAGEEEKGYIQTGVQSDGGRKD